MNLEEMYRHSEGKALLRRLWEVLAEWQEIAPSLCIVEVIRAMNKHKHPTPK